MADCTHCGGEVEWKNSAGHYREFCEPCAKAIAAEREPNPDLQTNE